MDVYLYTTFGLMNYKLYLYYDIFGGACGGEMDANVSSEMMVDTTDENNMTSTID